MTNYHVTKRPAGWAYKKAGASKATGIAPTKKVAEEKAKQIVKNQGGGEVVLHNKKNIIIDKDTVAPAKDPLPPKDKKH